MNKNEQKVFVKDIAANVLSEVLALIRKDRIPRTWDGHELRCFLADRYDVLAQRTTIRNRPDGDRAKRYREAARELDL